MKKPSYIIGIDLGTTNSTLAYLAPEKEGEIEQFLIPQVIKTGTQGEELSLPSFVYFPLEEELKKKATALEWDENRSFCVGAHAQNRGAEVPGRLVSSAKSWLCHSGIDRREKLLPLNGEEQKISPVEACKEFLSHLKEAWDCKHPEAPFVEQSLLITVPASFDPSARQLVQEAAEKAGYPEVILLEEPLAAFYAWIQKHADSWRKELFVGDTVLVVDIGGGTTDFSLISVSEEGGDLKLERVAVGSHLLLGGDNIDLALAYLAKGRLEELGHEIEEWQLQALVHSCRLAKEKLLGAKPPKSADVTIMGRGSRLIGGSLKVSLSLEDVKALVIDGFFPLVQLSEQSTPEARSGLSQVGLPFAQDARVTSQLAKFLSMGKAPGAENFILPSRVLFNGGTLKSEAIQSRVLEQLAQWASALGRQETKKLEGGDYDYAVSRGAAYYGYARTGNAIRIKSGINRSYFIGVEDSMPAIPGMSIPMKAICIAPFGMEEGTELALESQEFALVLGQVASFRFFSSSTPIMADGKEATIGSIVRRYKTDLDELHPIEARMDKKDDEGKSVCVKLRSKVTELGMLELWCASLDGRKWKLEFDIRQ